MLHDTMPSFAMMVSALIVGDNEQSSSPQEWRDVLNSLAQHMLSGLQRLQLILKELWRKRPDFLESGYESTLHSQFKDLPVEGIRHSQHILHYYQDFGLCLRQYSCLLVEPQ